MNPPLRDYPLILKSVLMFSLLMVFRSVGVYLAYMSIHSLFGIEKPEEILAGNFTGPNDRMAMLYLQGIGSLIGFVLSAILFAALESGAPFKHLGLQTKPAIKFLLLAIVAMLIGQFFIEFLIEANSSIPLPSSMAWVDEQQKEIERITNALMSFTDVGTFLITALVLAVVPAIGEEFFFRGLFMGDLLKNGVSPWVSILLSGLFFAVFHAEFNNTLAIAVLGCFLSYLYYVTGSLWVPIAAHFINNFFAILLKYLFNTGVINTDLAEASTPWYFTLASMLLFSGCIYLFYKWRNTNSFLVTPINHTHQQPEQE